MLQDCVCLKQYDKKRMWKNRAKKNKIKAAGYWASNR